MNALTTHPMMRIGANLAVTAALLVAGIGTAWGINPEALRTSVRRERERRRGSTRCAAPTQRRSRSRKGRRRFHRRDVRAVGRPRISAGDLYRLRADVTLGNCSCGPNAPSSRTATGAPSRGSPVRECRRVLLPRSSDSSSCAVRSSPDRREGSGDGCGPRTTLGNAVL
jgi:hypothetical protein